MIRTTSLALACALFAGPALADWTLSPGSSKISFASVKKGTVGEVHHFTGLTGGVDAGGKARVVIDADSLETWIDIRNERMRKWIFDTVATPTVTFETEIDVAALEALGVGEMTSVDATGMLTLAGQETEIEAGLIVARIGEDRALVMTDEMIMIDAAAIGRADGVEELRKVAELPSIATAVPVTLRLVFDRSSGEAAAAAPATEEEAPVEIAAAAPTGDVKKGKRVFNKCKSCHKIGKKAKHGTGPHLNGVFGRTAGTADGFKRYSDAMKDSGIVWDAETIAAYVMDPKGYIPGNKMSFRGLRKEADAENLIAYLYEETTE